jgi:hypothetical protein
MVLVVVVANCPIVAPFQSQNWKLDQHVHLCLLSSKLFKIVLRESFFAIFVVLSNHYKNPFKFRQRRRSLRKRKINRRWKWQTSRERPRLQRQNVGIFLLFSIFFVFLLSIFIVSFYIVFATSQQKFLLCSFWKYKMSKICLRKMKMSSHFVLCRHQKMPSPRFV